jgi:alpha-mannosidase
MVANAERLLPEQIEKYPGAHQYGFTLDFRYALFPHRGGWREADVPARAYEFKVPIKIIQGVRSRGSLPPVHSFLTLEPAGALVLSAFKAAEDGDGWVLRVWNSRREPVEARIRFGFAVARAARCRLDERREEDLEPEGDAVTVPCRACEIVTLRLAEAISGPRDRRAGGASARPASP